MLKWSISESLAVACVSEELRLGYAWLTQEVLRRGVYSIPNIKSFLGDEIGKCIGWGRKDSGRLAVRLASKGNAPLLLLEDGFLRSVLREDAPLSLVLDDTGIYYDATSPSSLERLVRQPLSLQEEHRARELMHAWRRGRISKYNAAREFQGELPSRYVLVADQTFGDLSVRYGMADERSFERMLEAALVENPDCEIVVKTHPDVFTRKRKGYFSPDVVARNPRIHVVAENCHPVRLIEQAERIYTVTSQIGFESLIWGKPVRCFGMPFYAGWGLTEDALARPDRRGPATIEQLVHAALVLYSRYVDPETGCRCEVERIVEYLTFQRRMRERLPARICAVGFSPWKRPILRRFVAGSQIIFKRSVDDSPPPDAAIAVWGNQKLEAKSATAPRIRIEDGFLRSVGLGAHLTQPLSWVIDDLGIYYDPNRESRLERILATSSFSFELLERAKALRQAIVSAGLSKYNSQNGGWNRPSGLSHVILVPGQVEDDASILCGAPVVRTNIDLLRSVRELHPDAYVVYKPHPDVVAAVRRSGESEHNALEFCDEVVIDAALPRMLEQVDEVHTMTSLAGFEALLRVIPVTCHGQPFYAGWGLTRDLLPHPRRTRLLTLDELVAGALILYPVYVSRKTGHYTTPEQVVQELVEWRAEEAAMNPVWRGVIKSVMRLTKGRILAKNSLARR